MVTAKDIKLLLYSVTEHLGLLLLRLLPRTAWTAWWTAAWGRVFLSPLAATRSHGVPCTEAYNLP
jgi:hypothetical protein